MKESTQKTGFFSGKGKDIIVIVTLIIIFSLLLEQTIRFYIFGFDSLSYQKMNSIKTVGHSGFMKASSVDSIVYEMKPNIDLQLKLVRVKTNSRGLRDKEYSIHKPPNTFRVAVVGSSFTFGAGVEIEDTYHSVLEDRLNKESGDLQYEFINFGVPGYTTRNKLATLKFKVLDYDPDLVLFVLDGSEFTDERYREFVPKATKNHFFTSYVYNLISINITFKPEDKRASEFTESQTNQLNLFNETLRELSVISKNYNIPLCIVVLDFDYLHLELSDEIQTTVEENNLCFTSTIPAFKNTNFNDFRIYLIDFHPNAQANKLFAESVYNDLIRQSLLEKRNLEEAQN